MRLGRLLLAMSLAIAVSGSSAALPQSELASMFQEAGRHYENAEYAEAVDVYLGVIEGGGKHPAVYYNLANAYFKSGQLGRAILNFERALSLAPRDQDIRTNLELARGFLIDKLPDMESSRVLSALAAPHRYTTLNETTLIVSGAFTLMMLAASALILTRRARSFLAAVVCVCVILLAYFSISLGAKTVSGRFDQAIVVVQETEVRSGPGDDFILEFTLHEGTKVKLESVEEEWSRIELAGSRRGWVSTDAIERIW